MPRNDQALQIEQGHGDGSLSVDAAASLGRVLSVGGSQVAVQLSTELSSTCANEAGVTVGRFLAIRTECALVIGVLSEISLDETSADSLATTGRVDLLGEIVSDAAGSERFQRGVTVHPTIGSAVYRVSTSLLRLIFDAAGPGTIDVGHVQQDDSIGAYLNVDNMVGKHFAVLGSTGAGKSSAVALILREIMAARLDLRILLLDPHNEYANCFETEAHVAKPSNLRLPFWLFNFDEIVEVIFGRRPDVDDEVALLSELIPIAKNVYVRSTSGDRTNYRVSKPEGPGYTVDSPVPYRLEDLIELIEGRMGKLENHALAIRYQRLLTRITTARNNPRYSFIFEDVNTGGDGMVDVLCELLCLPTDGPSMTIMQLAGFPAEVFDAVMSVLFRMALEFGIWSNGAVPLLIVCEEAHHYANADRSLGFRPAREAVSRIAKEGRKHGVFLGLVTQRPAELDATLISQCGTVIAMRMGNEDDQRIVRAAVSDPTDRLLGFLSSLGTREALAFGEGVPMAMRLRFKELPECFIPQSQAVSAEYVNPATKIDKNFVASVVASWRGVAVSNIPRRDAVKMPTAVHGRR